MKIIYMVTLIGMILFDSFVYAEGTQTFSQVQNDDITKSYLDLSKIVITKEKEGPTRTEKDVLCFTIDGKYKITDTKELLMLLIEMIKDIKAKP